MQENLEIKMSMLVDDELDSEETLQVLSEISTNPELRAKWNRYKSMSYALRHDSVVLPKPNFFDSVSQDLDSEPTIIGPTIARQKPRQFYPAIAAAVAASIVAVAIFTWSNLPMGLNKPLGTAVVSTVKEQPIAIQKVRFGKSPSVPSRLNDYLITHDESTYSAGTQSMLPYARVVSHSSSQ